MNHILISLVLLNFLGQLVTCSHIANVTAASTSFSQKLYQNLAKQFGSFIYSPYSIHSILALAYYGARGPTAVQIARTLFLSSIDSTTTAKTYQKIIRQMTSVKNVRFYSANGLLVNPKYKMNHTFIKVAREYYFTHSAYLKMSAPEGPEKAVNTFVAKYTKNTIKSILPKGIIKSNIALLFVNAVYFNGTWATKFNPVYTQENNFTRLKGGTSKVKMMKAESISVGLRQDYKRGVDTISLPFSNPRFSLYIVLPREVNGISNLEKNLKFAVDGDAASPKMLQLNVSLSLPKFNIETTVLLRPILIKMDMNPAFSHHADFSGMSPNKISINDVIHKAVINVEEAGVVDSAVTVSIPPNVLSKSQRPEISIIADHPFLFILRDNTNKQIVFQGKFVG